MSVVICSKFTKNDFYKLQEVNALTQKNKQSIEALASEVSKFKV